MTHGAPVWVWQVAGVVLGVAALAGAWPDLRRLVRWATRRSGRRRVRVRPPDGGVSGGLGSASQASDDREAD